MQNAIVPEMVMFAVNPAPTQGRAGAPGAKASAEGGPDWAAVFASLDQVVESGAHVLGAATGAAEAEVIETEETPDEGLAVLPLVEADAEAVDTPVLVPEAELTDGPAEDVMTASEEARQAEADETPLVPGLAPAVPLAPTDRTRSAPRSGPVAPLEVAMPRLATRVEASPAEAAASDPADPVNAEDDTPEVTVPPQWGARPIVETPKAATARAAPSEQDTEPTAVGGADEGKTLREFRPTPPGLAVADTMAPPLADPVRLFRDREVTGLGELVRSVSAARRPDAPAETRAQPSLVERIHALRTDMAPTADAAPRQDAAAEPMLPERPLRLREVLSAAAPLPAPQVQGMAGVPPSAGGESLQPLVPLPAGELAGITGELRALPAGALAGHVAAQAPGAPGIAQNVALQIAEVSRPLPDGPVELSLQPEELGRLKLSFTGGEAGLHVLITAERPETLDMMRRHIDLLAQEMRRLGHEGAQFSFAGGESAFGRQAGHGGEARNVGWIGEGDGTSAPVPSGPPAPRIGTAGLDLRL